MSSYFGKLVHQTARNLAHAAINKAPDGYEVIIREPRRTLEQNSLMWARLQTLHEQVLWDGERLTENEWKDLLTSCLRKQKVVRGVEGGLVFLGARTSRMSKSEMGDLLLLMEAFAAERGITFPDQASRQPNPLSLEA